MKILHLGNLANNSYKLAKFQRKLGEQASLELQHYQLSTGDNPANEDPELKDHFPDWISVNKKPIDHTFINRINIPARALRLASRVVENKLKSKGYDIIHAQAGSPVYAQFWDSGKLFSQCTGSDLRDVAFRNTFEGYLLRRAYRLSKAVFYTNIDHFKYLNKLNISTGQFLPNPLNLEGIKSAKKEYQFQGYNFVIFHPVRHSWTQKYLDMPSTKGNDKLIHAFAKLVKKNNKALLVMLNSGPDIELSKNLIAKYNLENNVKFVERLKKDQLFNYMKSCDLIADQFEIGAFGGASLEAMACGKPLLTYLDQESMEYCYGDNPPIFKAYTTDEIYEKLCLALDSNLTLIGDELQEWMNQHHDWQKVITKVLEAYQA